LTKAYELPRVKWKWRVS